MRIRRVVLAVLLLAVLSQGLVAADTRRIKRLILSRDAGARLRAVVLLKEIPGRLATELLIDLTGDVDPEVRDRAAGALRPRRAEEDLAALAARGLVHRAPFSRRTALRLLAAARVDGLEKHLAKALADRDPETREAAVGITVNALEGRGLPTLAAAVSHGREGRPRAAALLAVTGLDAEAGFHLARRAFRDRALEVRVAALEVLSGRSGEEGLSPLVAGLADDSWSVRLTAIRRLGVRADARAVPPLIGALSREQGRLREEVGDTLASLTGVGLPPDPARWNAWWAAEKERFKVPEKPAAVARPDDGSVATFHSIPITSRSVAFVLDGSRSMRQRLGRGSEKTKKRAVVEELDRTLRRMERSSRFYLVAFRSEPEVFAPRPVPVAARRRAVKWYEGLEPTGRTNLYDALALALAQPAVDTIFLLTDGAPSAGECRTRAAILPAVARQNRYRKAVIHTVEIGGGTTGKRWRGFLAELSRSTGGRHVRR